MLSSGGLRTRTSDRSCSRSLTVTRFVTNSTLSVAPWIGQRRSASGAPVRPRMPPPKSLFHFSVARPRPRSPRAVWPPPPPAPVRHKMADRPMQEILREALALSATRVIDLFKEWDEDGDGAVTKKEFRRAVPMLGLDPVPSKADIDALFDQWDPDGSGNIDFKELNKILRKSAEGLDPSLQAGAAGKIEMDSKAKTALRKGPNLQRGSSLAKVDLDEASDKSVAEQLRTILSKNAVPLPPSQPQP